MKIKVPGFVIDSIHAHGESLYPEEAAGLILGTVNDGAREARQVLPMANRFNSHERSHRYQLDPLELLQAEELAEQLGFEIIGIFHSHPDHPPAPSEFDLDWAMPWYFYLITSVNDGVPGETRAWQLLDDRSNMVEQEINLVEGER